MINVTTKATEDTRALLASNQETLKKNLEMWQDFNQAYFNLVVEAMQRHLEQSLALRQDVDQVLANSFKKAQELSLDERQFALDTVELFQSQVQSTSQYAAKMFTTTSKVITTTALFSDWAAERAAKVFTTISAN
jgi:hypothetical protein